MGEARYEQVTSCELRVTSYARAARETTSSKARVGRGKSQAPNHKSQTSINV
jgi:hypothetical protein